MQKVKTVKRSFLDQQAIGSLKKQHKDKTFLLFVLNFSVSKFFLWFIIFQSMSCALICFCLWLKNYKIKFLTAAEKQPIVSSKQPIVLSLTALWRNWFNWFFEFLAIADIFSKGESWSKDLWWMLITFREKLQQS